MATSLEAAIGVSVSRELHFFSTPLFLPFSTLSLLPSFSFFSLLPFHSHSLLSDTLLSSFSLLLFLLPLCRFPFSFVGYIRPLTLLRARTYTPALHGVRASRVAREYRLTRSSSSLDFSLLIINAVIIDCDLCVHANFQCLRDMVRAAAD